MKKANKQKIIDIDIKTNEAKSACITQKQQPMIQDMKPDVQIKRTPKLLWNISSNRFIKYKKWEPTFLKFTEFTSLLT